MYEYTKCLPGVTAGCCAVGVPGTDAALLPNGIIICEIDRNGTL